MVRFCVLGKSWFTNKYLVEQNAALYLKANFASAVRYERAYWLYTRKAAELYYYEFSLDQIC